jgi:hypothetical protein
MVALLLFTGACSAGYQGRVRDLHRAIDAGDTKSALAHANRALGVERAEQLPATVGGDVPLLLLERGALLQAEGDHAGARRDFAAADKALEVLDFTQDDAGEVGKYLFSDDTAVYRAPPHEKLLVNTLAMVSYLALGDIQGAKVEARRLTVLQKYFKDAAPEELALFGVGSYLAGFSFEAAGSPGEALLYYLEAQRSGGYDGLDPQISYLGRATASGDDAVAAAVESAPDAAPPGDDEGEILVVIQNGRAPYKVAQRFPIGAFVVVPLADQRYAMSPSQRADADRVIVSGLLKWINFPVLKGVDLRHRRFTVTTGSVSAGKPVIDLNVAEATLAAWENDRPKLMVAAFTRMVARAIAAEATTAVGKGSGLDKNLFPGASWLLGRVVEGGLTAADTPDTRSWTMLPSHIQIYRMRVKAGRHRVRIRSGVGSIEQNVEVRPGGSVVVSARFL